MFSFAFRRTVMTKYKIALYIRLSLEDRKFETTYRK